MAEEHQSGCVTQVQLDLMNRTIRRELIEIKQEMGKKDSDHKEEVSKLKEDGLKLKQDIVRMGSEHKDEVSNLQNDVTQLHQEVATMKSEDLPWLTGTVRGMQQVIDTITRVIHSRQTNENSNGNHQDGAVKPDHRELDMTPMDALTSTHDSFIDFTQGTTKHGVGQVFNYHNSKGKRIRHAIFFILALTWCCTMSGLAVRRYYSFPVASSTEVLYPEEMQYPAVTLCSKDIVKKSYYEAHVKSGSIYPWYEYAKHNQVSLEKQAVTYINQQVNLGKIETNFSINGNMTYSKLKANMGEDKWSEVSSRIDQDAERFLAVDRFKHMQAGGPQFSEIVKYKTFNVNYSSFIGYIDDEMSYTINGVKDTHRLCHTVAFIDATGQLLTKDTTTINRNPYMLLDFLEDEYISDTSPAYYIQVHPVGEMPVWGFDRWITVKPGRNEINVKRQDVSNLPLPYGATDCVRGHELKYYKLYTKQACLLECMLKDEIDRCGCKLYGDRPGPAEICNYTAHKECNIKYNCSHCLPGCESQAFTAYHRHIKSPFNAIRIDLGLAYTLISQQASYPGTSLLGEVGGLLGLCMGASLLTLMELVDLIHSMGNGLGISVMAGIRKYRQFPIGKKLSS